MKNPMQPVVKDEQGDYRFKCNAIVRFLLDRGRFDMNDLAAMPFANEDREQFAQLIGYSVSGFGELSYASQEACNQADRQIIADKANDEKTLLDLRKEWLDAESDSIVAGATAAELGVKYAKAVAKSEGFEQGDTYQGVYQINRLTPTISGPVQVELILNDSGQRVWMTLDEMKKVVGEHEQPNED